MAISNQQQQYQRTFIPLDDLPTGAGETGFKKDVTGILLGIEPRDGYYEFVDSRTGKKMTKPNSYIAHFADGSMFNWPTYLDEETGQVRIWNRFDTKLSLKELIQNEVTIHLWKDDRNFYHLEVVEEQVNLNPMPVVMAQANAPWQQQ